MLCCYVDDSTYTYSSSSPVELTATLSAQYMKLADYMRNNKLVINENKPHLVLMGGPRHKELRKQVSIIAGTVQVTSVETEKLLGLNIHQSMRWKEQVGTELGQAQLKLGLDFTSIFCTIKI